METSNAHLAGKLIDEEGLPPYNASYSVVAEGDFRGRQGYVRILGDHKVQSDGTFVSPPLPPGRYFLRFFGILRASASEKADEFRQERGFDFFYRDAATAAEAAPFDLRGGETRSYLIQVPRPAWFRIAGRIGGNLPLPGHRLCLMFQRNMEILPDVGGVGFSVDADGRFEGMLLKGAYAASLHEMAEPEPSGYTRSRKQFGSTTLSIEQDTLNLELALK